MVENEKQRICIQFCPRLGKAGPETYQMLQGDFGEVVLSRARVFEWFRRSKDEQDSVKTVGRKGRPSTMDGNNGREYVVSRSQP